MTAAENELIIRFIQRVGWIIDLDHARAKDYMLSRGERYVLLWINGNRDARLLAGVDNEYRVLMEACQ